MNSVNKSAALSVSLLVGMSLVIPTLESGDECSLMDNWEIGSLDVRMAPNREQVKPLLDHPLRDPSICKGPDGTYYFIGTDGTPNIGDVLPAKP